MLILIAGPYRSGTGGDPILIEKNLRNLEAPVPVLTEKGHIPIISEWVALPIMKAAGMKTVGDEVWEKYQYPIAHALLAKCDAVLRIEGASTGADQDVEVAKSLGLKVFYKVEEVPDAE